MIKFNDDFISRLESVVIDADGWDDDEISIIVDEQKDDYTRGYLSCLMSVWNDRGDSTEDIRENLIHFANRA